MRVVIDASATLDLLVPTERGQAISGYVHGLEAELHAPSHLRIECTNALRSMVLCGALPEERASACLMDVLDLPVTVWPDEAVGLRQVWELRHRLTAYDAAYLALAHNLDATVVTSDRRFAMTGHQSGLAPIVTF